MGPRASKLKAAPVVFLDIDGVLNSCESRATGDHDLAPPLVAHLEYLVTATAAEIVLSSTWRLEPLLEQQVRETLAWRGMELRGKTPDMESTGLGDRVDEIFAWLAEHRGGAAAGAAHCFVAIDDLALSAMNPKLAEQHFVRTSDSVGLTREGAEEAVRKLRRQQGPHQAVRLSDNKLKARE
jgi:hypothetical protein